MKRPDGKNCPCGNNCDVNKCPKECPNCGDLSHAISWLNDGLSVLESQGKKCGYNHLGVKLAIHTALKEVENHLEKGARFQCSACGELCTLSTGKKHATPPSACCKGKGIHASHWKRIEESD